MKIITDSIRDGVEIQLNKSIEDIGADELKEIKQLSIERSGFDFEVKAVDYTEIKLFENLEELTLFECMINTEVMNCIKGLTRLRKLTIYNSDFIDFSNVFFDHLKVEELVLSNCLGLKNIVLKGFRYLELRNIEMNCIIKDIGILNLVNINNDIYVGRLENVERLMIAENDYKRDQRIADIDSVIVVMDDGMNIVEEINK